MFRETRLLADAAVIADLRDLGWSLYNLNALINARAIDSLQGVGRLHYRGDPDHPHYRGAADWVKAGKAAPEEFKIRAKKIIQINIEKGLLSPDGRTILGRYFDFGGTATAARFNQIKS